MGSRLNGDTRVRDWYLLTYKDEVGNEINPTINFNQVLNAMQNKASFYEFTGVMDNIVRERIFGCLAKLFFRGDYQKVYHIWKD